MEKYTEFEDYLYGDNDITQDFEIFDADFCAEHLARLPTLRPFSLEKSFRLCCKFCENEQFRELLLKKSSYYCPLLLYRLYKHGIYEIMKILLTKGSFVSLYYFRKRIDDFENKIKKIPKMYQLEQSILEDDWEMDLLIEYGFSPSSIEYCMKYDDIDAFKQKIIYSSEILNQQAQWSPLEWSRDPKVYDFLSFSAYFGSINCFRHMLMNGWVINEKTNCISVCSGNTDLFHLCNQNVFDYSEHFCLASEFNRKSFLYFLVEKGINVDSKNSENFSALLSASEQDHISIVEYLLNKGANIEQVDQNACTPLHYATLFGYQALLLCLLSHGANVNSMDWYTLFAFLIPLLFIMQLIMDILESLSVLYKMDQKLMLKITVFSITRIVDSSSCRIKARFC